jgi:5-methylcytosine-specific restriction endonuclease McrA
MPSSPGYQRDYHQEYLNESRERRKLRAMRNAARRQLAKEGLVRKGDGKHVNHVNPLDKGGGNSRKNLTVASGKKNSSYARTSKGQMRARYSRPGR